MCVDAPDTTEMNAAAKSSADIAKESLDWFKAEAARTQGQRDTAAANADLIAKEGLATMRSQNELAKDYADYNKTTFRPLEQGIVADAQGYDTTERRQAAADAATADVRGALGRATGSTMRTSARMGYTPTMNADRLALGTALAEAGAATNARRTVEGTGRAMRMDAASLGRNLPSAQATAIQTGIGAGQGSLQAGQSGLAATDGAARLMSQGFNTGLAGHGQSGNLYAQIESARSGASGANAGMMGQFGQMAGMMAMMKSSKKSKARMTPQDPDEVLEALEGLKSEGWQYKEGQGDGEEHLGTYAEDMQKAFGDEAAPGGKMISIPAAKQINSQALAALNSRVKKLEAALRA